MTTRTPTQTANLTRLIAALREEVFPTGFAFNYSIELRSVDDWDIMNHDPIDYRGNARTCGSIGCGMGLMKVLGMIDVVNTKAAANALGIDWIRDSNRIFYDADTYGKTWDDVTPGEVADELEKLL
jgi:hypothetical protein